MKKIYSIMLLTLLSCVMAWGANVASLSELQNALANGGNITLTADIDAGAQQLNVTKATTINGQGFCVKGTNTYVFQVNTTGKVVMENLVIWAAKTSKAGRGILINNNTNNADLTLNNVTINATYRAMDVWYSDGVKLAINNCTFQNVQGQAVDAQGNPTAAKYDIELTGTNAGDTRGLNFGQLTNSTITIDNSTMQGFFYVLNNVTGSNGDMTGTTLTASNSTFKGRAALNVWGFGGNYTFNDCAVIGINNYGSSQEGFACFVFNNQTTCHDNSLTINGGTVVSAVFDAVGASNPNANQYFVDTRYNASNINIVINNSQYTCTKELGEDKGGIIYRLSPSSTLVVNDGVYNCPNIIAGAYSKAGVTGNLTINGGQYNLSVISLDMADGDMYSAVSLAGGTFNLDMETPVDPGNADNDLIADGYKQVTNLNGTYSIVPAVTESATALNDVNWTTPSDWTTTSLGENEIPDDKTSVAIGDGSQEVSVVVANGDEGEAYRVDLADKVTLTVKDEGVLTIGEGGIVAHENAEVKVEDGGTLILNGLVQGTENVIIETSENSNTTLLLNPDINVYGDEHPKATYRFTSKSYKNGTKVVHQRFGMPTYNNNVTMAYADPTRAGVKTYIVNWDYENDQWAQTDAGAIAWKNIPAVSTEALETVGAFTCYDLISNNAKDEPMTYEFTGDLMGNSDAAMSFNHGFNPYANSYTAPINIASFLERIEDEYAGTDIHPTIYLYKALANDNYTWITIGLDEAIFGDGEYTEIVPMQAFMMYLGSSTPQIASIDYKDNVYDPFMTKLNGGSGNGAPKRQRAAAKSNYLSMTIIDAEGQEYDRVKLIEDNRFSTAFDNGFDAVKFMKDDVCLYANAEEAQATLASDDVENMYLGVKVAQSGVYTLNIKHNGLDYALVDLVNNNVIELVAGNTYNFFQEAGNNDARFQVVKVNKVSTSIDEVENDQVLTTKVVKNGVLYILKNGAVYNAQGQIVK